MLGADAMKQLKKLFKSANGESDSDGENDEMRVRGNQQIGPGDIGQFKTSNSKNKSFTDPNEHVQICSYAPLPQRVNIDAKSIEEWERQQEDECENLLEARSQPEYKISYKQYVGTEDIFLQMNGKTPSTASCENMIVDIFLNDEQAVGIHHIDLTVQEQRVVIKSPKYFLNLQLPHKVDPDKGKAAWISEEKLLKLTLKVIREYDFVNF